MQPLIQADQLSFSQNKRLILDNISLEVKEQDFITVVGPNGAGKSTLLQCLVGALAPEHGTVKRKAGLRIGYVPQHSHTNPTIPIKVRRFLTLKKGATDDAIAHFANETKIEHILDRGLHDLSKGEMQRVLITRAMLDEPELLILDEPEQNLDVHGQLKLFTLLENIYNNHDLAILLVSHDLHLVMSCTKHVVCLSQHVCCSGEPQIVTKDPEFIALFGDDVARQMAVYQHSHQGHTHD